MKTPPLLLLATLLFWGWQSKLLLWGALAGVALEAARALPSRWDLEDAEFSRIWSFCAIILLALGGYVFTNGAGGEGGLCMAAKPWAISARPPRWPRTAFCAGCRWCFCRS